MSFPPVADRVLLRRGIIDTDEKPALGPDAAFDVAASMLTRSSGRNTTRSEPYFGERIST
jgi:hypothetical protein